MTTKHKVIQDYQLTTPDKKIIILKAKTNIIDYRYINKTDNILVEKDIIDNNPEYFAIVDWKEDFTNYLKTNKIPQPAVLSKKITPFFEEMLNNLTSDGQTTSTISESDKDIKKIESKLKDREDEVKSREEAASKYESYLNEQIEKLNKSIIDSEEKQKLLQKELDKRQKELEKKEIEMSKVESKEDSQVINNDTHINRQELRNRINEIMGMYAQQGFSTNSFEKLFGELGI